LVGEALWETNCDGRFNGLIGPFCGYSFRVGAAIDLLEAGESLEKIMLRGGWQSDATTIRYLRRWNNLYCGR
jgi:hypothetical protein